MGENSIIRKVTAADNLVLAMIIREVIEEHDAPRTGTVYSNPSTDNLYELFRKNNSILWVAQMNNEVEGCCGIYPTKGLDDDTGELVKFYLSASARSKGIGKALMERSILSARELGYKKLYIESLPQFSKAVNMYLQQGFQMIEKPLGNSGHTSCNIWMLKELF